mmetsp:Transcript_7165/g.23991  ORF Transcript_7165/g.23991 Transcript_7165/m.23991 type:complete len:204 (-) Transcript_7165:332-943(-)
MEDPSCQSYIRLDFSFRRKTLPSRFPRRERLGLVKQRFRGPHAVGEHQAGRGSKSRHVRGDELGFSAKFRNGSDRLFRQRNGEGIFFANRQRRRRRYRLFGFPNQVLDDTQCERKRLTRAEIVHVLLHPPHFRPRFREVRIQVNRGEEKREGHDCRDEDFENEHDQKRKRNTPRRRTRRFRATRRRSKRRGVNRTRLYFVHLL